MRNAWVTYKREGYPLKKFVYSLLMPVAATLALVACGGGAGGVSVAADRQTQGASGPATFNYTPGFVCCPSPSAITVQPDGAATKSVGGKTVATAQLSSTLTAKIFSDLSEAWPLNALPVISVIPDTGGLTISWGGETTPNIVNASSGIEGALNSDATDVAHAFP